VLAVPLPIARARTGGVKLDDARMIFFRLAADVDQFLTIAKFRALRKLWARVEEACGLVPEPAFISAEAAWRMMTKRDPYVKCCARPSRSPPPAAGRRPCAVHGFSARLAQRIARSGSRATRR
jgi:hypothetical protein